jgi:apolipoprotein N-acyltransferase
MSRQILTISIAAVLGAMLGLVYAPYYYIPLLFISLPAIYTIISRSPSFPAALATAYVFSFSYMLPSVFWTSKALSIDVGFAGLIPVTLIGVPGYMALAPTGCFAILYLNRERGHLARLLVFASSWVIFEYLRSLMTFGFSLNYIGYAVAFSDELSQAASVVGIYGLSFLTVLLGTVPAAIFSATNLRRACYETSLLSLAMSMLFIGGGYRLAHNSTEYNYGVKLRIVQGGIAPHELWRTRQMQNMLVHKYLSLSLSKGYESITHFIWGEGTLPLAVNADLSNFRSIMDGFPQGSFLFTGSSRVESNTDDVFNSLIAIESSSGRIKAHYDKVHLVPFGEFLPFRWLLGRLFSDEWISHSTNYSVGKRSNRAIMLENTPNFYAIICYETMFPGTLLSSMSKSAAEGQALNWILNVTNDGWFGISAGPYQHLASAKIRTIESGLPFIRSTNTGVSAVYDAYGRILQSIPINTEGVMDIFLPRRVAKTVLSTLYPNVIKPQWLPFVICIMFVWYLEPLVRRFMKSVSAENK